MKKIILSFLMLSITASAEEKAEATVAPPIPGSEIYLFDINNKGDFPQLGAGKNITRSVGYDSQPHFDKKGKKVYYTKIRNGQADIYQYDIKSNSNQAYMSTPESEYSPTTIPGEKGLSVIQVDDKGDQYLVKLNKNNKKQKTTRYSGLKQVGYHNWTQNDGTNNGMHLWTFILNNTNGGDLYHQGKNKKAKKVEEKIGRSFITDKNNKTLYYVDKKNTPWQIKSRNKAKGSGKAVMDMVVGSEDFTMDSKGRFWMGEGNKLYVSTNKKHWTLIKQFTNPALGNITRITTNPKGNKIAVVLDEVTGQ